LQSWNSKRIPQEVNFVISIGVQTPH